jgi:hypothetical protein
MSLEGPRVASSLFRVAQLLRRACHIAPVENSCTEGSGSEIIFGSRAYKLCARSKKIQEN